MNKIKKTIVIAIFVSLAAQIRFELITDGFIIAMSVLVMSIFIYCYEDLSPMYIAFCSGIFSPLFRMGIILVEGGAWKNTAETVIPDMVFFFAYGMIYTLIYRIILNESKGIKSFPYVIFACDICSNLIELATRSLLAGEMLINVEVVAYLTAIAICRTILIQMILVALETYSNLLVKKEHDEEYRKLIVQASVLESEIYVMEKNAAEVEEIMKQAFQLYKSMEAFDVPKELRQQSLDISKNAHEVKGDYQSVITILKDAFVDQFHQGRLSITDIISIEKTNLVAMIHKTGKSIEVQTKIKCDFYVNQYFKMMSIIRNLLLNSTEALDEAGGTISITLKSNEENYVLVVRDNGKGIASEKMDAVFFEGYSTKFNEETGDIQRGIGLSLVKDYVEGTFQGEIQVESNEGEYTEFVVTFPEKIFQEVEEDELLHH
ncbi:two-component system sensor histidine kinase YcbA [Clostridiales Family XIII bacterium PM5-7]